MPSNADLFYCTPDARDGVFPERLEALCQATVVRLHCRLTDREGPLKHQVVAAALQPASTVWFCGPSAWRAALGRALNDSGLPAGAFHREVFEFR